MEEYFRGGSVEALVMLTVLEGLLPVGELPVRARGCVRAGNCSEDRESKDRCV